MDVKTDLTSHTGISACHKPKRLEAITAVLYREVGLENNNIIQIIHILSQYFHCSSADAYICNDVRHWST